MRGTTWMRAAAGALLGLLLVSCQMEMGVGAKLRRNGSGTFSLAVAADKEFIDGLERPPSKGGLGLEGGFKGFEDLFASLRVAGWNVQRTQTPKGDIALRGTCAFKDPKDFDRCLGQLASGNDRSRGVQFRDTGLSIGVGVHRGFFKTRTFVAGSVDLAGPRISNDPRLARSLSQLQAFASQVFTFDVRVELPGTPRITSGASAGTVNGSLVIWKPAIGERLDFRADSDAYNPIAIVLVSLPVVLLAGLLVWTLVRRKPSDRERDEGGFVPGDLVPPASIGSQSPPIA